MNMGLPDLKIKHLENIGRQYNATNCMFLMKVQKSACRNFEIVDVQSAN